MRQIINPNDEPSVQLKNVMKNYCDSRVMTELCIPDEDESLNRSITVFKDPLSTNEICFNCDTGNEVYLRCADGTAETIAGIEGNYSTKLGEEVYLSAQKASELLMILRASEDDKVLAYVRRMCRFREEIKKAPNESAEKLIDFLSASNRSALLSLIRQDSKKSYSIAFKIENTANASSVRITYYLNAYGVIDNNCHMNIDVIKEYPFGSLEFSTAFRADELYQNRKFAKFTGSEYAKLRKDNLPATGALKSYFIAPTI